MGKKKSWAQGSDCPPAPPNDFQDDFLDYIGSPEGALLMEVSDTLRTDLEEMHLDAKKRQILWKDGAGLGIKASVKKFANLYPEYPESQIESSLTAWMEMDYVPEGLSTEQFDEFERLIDLWVGDEMGPARL